METLTRTASIAIERKKAEEALRKSERRLHEILEALPSAVYTTDAEGRITMFNKAATEFSGRVPELGSDSWCVSWKLYDLDGAPLPHDQCPMAIALKESRPVRGSYAIAERPDGSRLKFAPYPTPLFDDSGKLKGAVNMLVDLTEQGIAEESLRVSEERLRAILNSSAVGVALVTPESRFLQVNNAFSMITGYSEQELLGVDCAFLTAPSYHEAMRENIDLLIAGRIPTFVMEKEYCRKDGRLIWVLISVSMTRDSQGNPQHLVALCQDIDERKQAEAVIQSRTAQFETLLQEAPLGVYLIDSDFLIREVNPKAAVIFGNTSPIGRDFADVMGDLWAGAEAQEIVQRFRHTLETGEPYNSPEYASRRLDSEYYEWQINRIMLPEGRFGVVCYFRDISGHVLARKAIRDSEEKLRFMAESMPQKIFAANPSGEVIYFNQQWTLFTGLSFEQIEKWGWTQFIHSDDVEENVRLWKHSVATGEPFEFTHRFRRSDGVYRWHLSRAQAMRDASGAITLWIGSNTEIHEQKDIEENLRLANNDLEQFAFSASHDLREPIRNISIYGQILKKSYSQFLDEQGQQYLDFMTRGAGRLDVLLKDLLAYTQSGAQVADEKVWTEAEIGLNKAISALSEAIKEAGAAVTHDPLPTVRLPEVQIHQLFQNLIGNAIKYRRDDVAPTVHVSAAQRGSFTVFSISDNGIGIAPDYKEKIFGIFKRLHNDAKYTGSGIGLAICQKIVERNGGRIWMESEGEGHGSTFHFTLPN